MTQGREGTNFREGRIIEGACEACGREDTILYSHDSDPSLLCADCQRKRVKANPTEQACDNCGATGNVWRDPVHRRNEYLCIRCHDPASLFQNRWANKVRESHGLGIRERPECEAAGYGTECRGEVRWRGDVKRSLCNKHAGRTSANPRNN